MYQRMLDKTTQPTLEQMTAYCGEGAQIFTNINQWLTTHFQTTTNIEFPYGNKYGWCVAHRIKSKFICNIFPEDNALTVMLRLNNTDFDALLPQLTEYTCNLIEHKYPCGEGGWLHMRLLNEQHFADAQVLLQRKITHK